jgi:ATP-dependent helicase YprA (DUF1998 family)
MGKLFALNVNELEVVSNDGAPSGDKEYLLWDPPLVDPMAPSLGRRSSLSEASSIMRFLMKKGVRVILFCKVKFVASSRYAVTMTKLFHLDSQSLRTGKASFKATNSIIKDRAI